jgi:predicted alpha/beta-fold hydrolase
MINLRTPTTPFKPGRLVRSRVAQTALTMIPPRDTTLYVDEQPMLFDAGPDHTGIDPTQPVRLLGYYNRHRRSGASRGLVLVLHGWEGCSHSKTNLRLGQRLVDEGYDILRLNLRDHGPGIDLDPYGLNKGLFLGTLLEEVATATHHIAALAGERPFHITGASMGGNFALRLARWHSERTPFHNLRKIVVICPALHPGRATDALDAHPATRRYYRQRWLRSLRAKRLVNPALPDLAEIERMPLVRDMTDWFIRQPAVASTPRFTSAAEYFAAYSVLGDALAQLTVRTTILTARNDPVIPVVDFYTLAPHPLLDVQIHASGGHCGFIDAPPVRHRMADLILPELATT